MADSGAIFRGADLHLWPKVSFQFLLGLLRIEKQTHAEISNAE
jgi:hypothetical protein